MIGSLGALPLLVPVPLVVQDVVNFEISSSVEPATGSDFVVMTTQEVDNAGGVDLNGDGSLTAVQVIARPDGEVIDVLDLESWEYRKSKKARADRVRIAKEFTSAGDRVAAMVSGGRCVLPTL